MNEPLNPATLEFGIRRLTPPGLPLRNTVLTKGAAALNGAPVDEVLRYRRASALLFFYKADEVIITNYLQEQTLSCNLQCAGFLAQLEHWQTSDELIAKLAGYTDESVTKMLHLLMESSILLDNRSNVNEADHLLNKHWAWGHKAAYFHFGSKYRSVISSQKHSAIQRLKAKVDPPPSLVTTNAGFKPEYSLPLPAITCELYQTMAARRTSRQLNGAAIPLQALSECLFFSLYITGWIGSPEIQDLPLKMTPSGGARNPFEAYVYAKKVTGLEPGFYHYSATEHSLGAITCLHLPRFEELFSKHQEGPDTASAAIFLVANFERTMWKYKSSYTYRTILIEAGHIGQNIMLAGTRNGLAVNPSGAIAEDIIEQALAINPIKQAVMYSLFIGQPAKQL